MCHSFVDILYPPRCVGCGGIAARPLNVLCSHCLVSIPRIGRADVEQAISSGVPTAERISLVSALWLYNAGAVTGYIQKQLKYGNRPELGRELGLLMGRCVENDLRRSGIRQPEMVVPIPLSRIRRLERGYNQARYLADGVGEILSVPVRSVLRKEPGVRSQTGLSRAARMQNLASAFVSSRSDSPAGRRVLIVDDVWTTGATVGSAADALLKTGAISVSAAVLALTLHS